MMNLRWTILLVFLGLAAGSGSSAPAADSGAGHGITEQYLPRWQAGYEAYEGKVRNVKLGKPTWSTDDAYFLYTRETSGGGREHVRVRTADGAVEVAAERSTLESGINWVPARTGGKRRGKETSGGAESKPDAEETRDPDVSPDGKWRVVFSGHNVTLHGPLPENNSERVMTTDGNDKHAYRGPAVWAPDSRHFAVWKVRDVPERKVHLVEASPEGQEQPRHSTYPYPKPGDEIDTRAPWVFAADGSPPMAPDETLIPNPMETDNIEWREDSCRLTYEYFERGYGKFRVIEMNVAARAQRVLVGEESDTFVDSSGKVFRHDLAGGERILWMSERDGWNHLYQFDGRTGKMLNQITKGEWVVRGVKNVDEAAGEIVFTASGRNAGEDPYHLHWYRVKIDGTGLTALTAGDGNHDVVFSPGGKYYIDTWSRVDSAPVHELRRAADGGLIRVLEKADDSALRQAGWLPPVRFKAKDRNGNFDIWGFIIRPIPFDPAKKYPVLETIYAGPQDSHVPKDFFVWGVTYHELASEGFMVVAIDGLGTSNRSREFHHFCYKNLADAGLPDRIAWMKAAAANEPSMDITRVGIYGGSAGGQNALGALLFHPDFYKAAAADCGCHDNRMDKLWWNEQWMDWPVGPHYAAQSNVTNVGKLQGSLLLTVGALDRNVDPASTMQVADALIKADKEFELLVMPGDGHGVGESSAYARARRAAFFKRALGGPVERE